MEQELEFYRRIVSPGEGKDALQIECFRMSSDSGDDQFSLTLSQGVGRSAKIRAISTLRFVGTLSGEKQTLSLQGYRYCETEASEIFIPILPDC